MTSHTIMSKNRSFKYFLINSFGLLLVCLTSCSTSQNKGSNNNPTDTLPQPYATKSAMNFSHVIGWKEGRTPTAPNGFTVTKYADKFENPRWMYVTPNGDVLVAESNSNHSLLEKIGGRIITGIG